MKFASVLVGDRDTIVFKSDTDDVVDIAVPWKEMGFERPSPRNLDEMVSGDPEFRTLVQKAVNYWMRERDETAVVSKGDIRWLPPIRRPSKIVGVAINNSIFAPAAHRYFEDPAFFLKPPSSLVGHNEPIEVESWYGLTHPEPELACVIGKRVRRLSEEEALDSIFGYSIINDITSPGLKDRDSVHLKIPRIMMKNAESPQWREQRDEDDYDLYLTYHTRSKGSDTFGPMGPWLTTADEISDPNDLAIRAWLGDDLITEDTTAALSFSVQRVLSHLTKTMTLEPGDIVHFGTAASPAKFSIRDADISRLDGVLAVEIEGLGTLRNPVQRDG